MKKMKYGVLLAVLALPVLGMSGCGMGKKLVRSLEFSAGDENGHLVAGFDAKVEMGLGALPEIKLPIYDPKSPSRFLGYIETHYDGGITLRVDVTEATKIKVTDGTTLPNGRQIPIALPTGVVPIAIPVVNSSSKVYLAVGQQNLMAGVAITLLADPAAGNTDWIRTLQKLPANLFYPFQIAADLKGTAGLFTGDKVGVGVFAVKTISKPEKTLDFSGGDFSSTSLTTAQIRKVAPEAKTEVFGVKTQYPVGSKMYRIVRALGKGRDTRLD